MKKLISVIIMIALLTVFAADAFAEKFIIRNGIHWGDSVESVKANEEGAVDYEDAFDGFYGLSYVEKKVSNYTTDLQYIFYNDELMLFGYVWNDFPEEDQMYLIDALTYKYGEPIENDFERACMLLEVVEPAPSDMELLSNWELEDGTYIVAFKSEEYEIFDIIYFCEEALLEVRENRFNVDGL